jgi:arylsulfatase A-like enzyme
VVASRVESSVKTRGRGVATLALSTALVGFAGRAAQASPPPSNDRPNIILIVLDTVRADAIGFSRLRPGAKTPFLDSWSRGALVYRHALSPADSTPESHFSMFTGYPAGAFGTSADTPESSVVAQLNDAGYDTVGLSANPLVHPRVLNAAKPFQTFVTSPYVSPAPLKAHVYETLRHYWVPPHSDGWGVEKTSAKVQSSAEEINALLDGVLSACNRPAEAPRPLFLFLNFLDGHDPYTAPPPFSPSSEELWAHWPVNGDLRSGPQRDDTPKGDRGVPEWRHASRFSPDEIRYLRSLYDREVQYLDSQLAALFKELRRHGILKNAIVLITSDHGEAFGEQGFLMHHLESFGIHIPELYHVPLAIRGYGVQLEARKSLRTRFSTTLVADSVRSWSGVRRGLGPELDPIATVVKTNTRLTKAKPAPSQGAPFPPPAGADSQREKAARSEPQNEELIRRLRSLGYIR